MGLLDKFKNSLARVLTKGNAKYDQVIDHAVAEVKLLHRFFYMAKANEINSFIHFITPLTDKEKIDFAVYCIQQKFLYTDPNETYYGDDIRNHRNLVRTIFIQHIFKSKLLVDEQDLTLILQSIYGHEKKDMFYFREWGLSSLVNQLLKQYKDQVLTPEFVNAISYFKEQLALEKSTYWDKDKLKLIQKLDELIFVPSSPDEKKQVLFLGEDAFATFANPTILAKENAEKYLWFQLLDLAQKAKGSKPSNKYLSDAKVLIQALGADKFKKQTQAWFSFLISLKEIMIETVHQYEQGGSYTYRTYQFLSALNVEALKGLVWMNANFYDANTIQHLSKLAERCFKKIPEVGPTAASLGNACLFSLYQSKGLDGIGQLSRLRLKIKQANTLTIIEKYIQEAALKLGISTDEIEDLSVDDYGLVEGKRTYELGNFTCVIEIIGIGKSSLRWFKEEGVEQKTIPQIIKDKYAEKLKKIKATQKQIDQSTSAQRDRFDRMLRGNRVMTVQYFQEKYLQHGLISFVAKKVIFNFIQEGNIVQAACMNEVWQTSNSTSLQLDQFNEVSFWHPVTSSPQDVKAWREFLIQHQIQQPFKQAFREIYLLTEAELNTRTYSNRMAAHILKQHQYVTLAKGRNWKAKLIGSWDGGDDDTATLFLSEYNLRAEYWVNALQADEAYNETGIWNYVSTDQVRFVDTRTEEVINLIDVPTIPFSEVMRDIDLFVGVSSVGNDPTWRDSGGLPAYRDYWQAYSFGDLSEVAKNRKEILSSLIPRLKIAAVTSIQDKFVVVQGKIRTYKIHIGSTNILMEPNDQYLCIVPDRSTKSAADKVFLPFEGDQGLSVILSKAFLLAADDQITDSTITSQLHR